MHTCANSRISFNKNKTGPGKKVVDLLIKLSVKSVKTASRQKVIETKFPHSVRPDVLRNPCKSPHRCIDARCHRNQGFHNAVQFMCASPVNDHAAFERTIECGP